MKGEAKALPKQRGAKVDSMEDRFAKLENLVMSLAQSMTTSYATVQPSTTTPNIEEERRAAEKLSHLLPQEVGEQLNEKEEPQQKKAKKKAKGLRQPKSARMLRRSRS